MLSRSSLLVLFFACASAGHATHLIGGELYYDHISGDDYQVTLKLYRDCGPNNTNGTGFDANAEIGVFDNAGNWLFSELFTLPVPVLIPISLSNPCLTVPPGICVEEASYTGVITLPSGTGGYTLAYQRCCRTPVTINLNSPNTQGITCMVKVPDTAVTGANSSPHFANYPPIVWCNSEAMVFDHHAVDADGDALTYELCAPFQGADQFNPMPSPPAPPPACRRGPRRWRPGGSSGCGG